MFKEQIASAYRNLWVYGEKIFRDQGGIDYLKEEYNIEVLLCNKRKKGQAYLHADQKLFNTLVSKARQPVESFFNWLEEKQASSALLKSSPSKSCSNTSLAL